MRNSSVLALSLLSVGCAASPAAELHLVDGRIAVQLVQRAPDAADPRAAIKVYHHLTAPDGRRITKGEGGKFEHHRGLFVGWNHTRWNGADHDFWHMPRGERQRFAGYVEPAELGMGADAQVIAVDWCTAAGDVVVRERRGVELVAQSDERYTLLLRIELTAPNGDVQLTGDPQHSGQQLRALQRFAEDGAEPVRYLRPTFAK